ncbi:SDR family NAD(P)-dependent oxidoreductase [Streptomyces sp. NP160]|uniref:SDR family oxidoreductase n=1 Tax=Streptomyces sp. NP160 TaxID=2586637 RepID=UPI00111AB496|nr:SDR family oxidoreductase [Streptomyces sp. NP160]TNM59814.1 SDR family NAD(P)-dependent oxidoreductase [Streptomyces sp. NP160]
MTRPVPVFNLAGASVLVTGANRGLGAEFVRQALELGAARVYATTRRPSSIRLDDPRVVVLELDVTDPATVSAAAASVEQDDRDRGGAGGLDVVVNNAGIATATDLVSGDLRSIRAEMDTHFYGALTVTRALAPLLARRPRSAVVNVLSVLSFRSFPGNGAYAAAKAAAWMLTNSTRLELAAQGTQVLGLHVSSVDTDMMAGWDVPKSAPVDVVRQALQGLVDGLSEVLADEETREVKRLLPAAPEVLYAPFLQGIDQRRAPGAPPATPPAV